MLIYRLNGINLGKAFVFEVLEALEDQEEPGFNQEEELKKLEKKWLDKLQPYGERGYNKRPLG